MPLSSSHYESVSTPESWYLVAQAGWSRLRSRAGPPPPLAVVDGARRDVSQSQSNRARQSHRRRLDTIVDLFVASVVENQLLAKPGCRPCGIAL